MAIKIQQHSILYFGAKNVVSTTIDRWLFPGYATAQAKTEEIFIRIPFDCELSNFYVDHMKPNGNGKIIVYTVQIDSISTALKVSLPSTSLSASNLINRINVKKGQKISVLVTKALAIGAPPNNILCSLQIKNK